MIRFQYGDTLMQIPKLKASMHRDRAIQFKQRLRWDVTVDAYGEEHDGYDELNPIYIIVENDEGLHAGSMRLLPTVGQTMTNDHFIHLSDGVAIQSPFIWECTRLCLGESADRTTAPALLAAGAKLMHECEIQHFVGVFDARMTKIYARLGAKPTILGTSCTDGDAISVGLWEFDNSSFLRLCHKACLDPQTLASQFDVSEIGGNRSIMLNPNVRVQEASWQVYSQ
ncbi:acyl-homoserine-lactone synthase [Marivita sp. S0852]|uniref:acyl-homoserine-lactone synthase n=1 Tax=Marivita sp. S0852 TaxID=3373893 RepID=UPI003982659E